MACERQKHGLTVGMSGAFCAPVQIIVHQRRVDEDAMHVPLEGVRHFRHLLNLHQPRRSVCIRTAVDDDDAIPSGEVHRSKRFKELSDGCGITVARSVDDELDLSEARALWPVHGWPRRWPARDSHLEELVLVVSGGKAALLRRARLEHHVGRLEVARGRQECVMLCVLHLPVAPSLRRIRSAAEGPTMRGPAGQAVREALHLRVNGLDDALP